MKTKQLLNWQRTCCTNNRTQTLATLRVIKAGGKGHRKSQETPDILKINGGGKMKIIGVALSTIIVLFYCSLTLLCLLTLH